MIQLKQEYGGFLNQFKWDWFATLTFDKPVGIKSAFKQFNKWKVKLKNAAGNSINYVMVIEPNSNRDNIHFHILLSGAKTAKPYFWQQQWYEMAGIAKIEPYNPDLGANYYLGKKMLKSNSIVKYSKDIKDEK